eukprot:753676-Hanusia_phi.AAC.9
MGPGDDEARMRRALRKTQEALEEASAELAALKEQQMGEKMKCLQLELALQEERKLRHGAVQDATSVAQFEARMAKTMEEELAEVRKRERELRAEMNRMQAASEEAKFEKLPHDWPTVKALWLGVEQKKKQISCRESLYSSLFENMKKQIEILKQEVRLSRMDLMDIMESLQTWNQDNIKKERGYISNILKLEDRCVLLQNEIQSAREAWHYAENERIELEHAAAELRQNISDCAPALNAEREKNASLQESLKQALEDSLSKSRLMILEKEKSIIREKALTLYQKADLQQAKPLFEMLLEMNPSDEEALACYQQILQKRILTKTSKYTLQVSPWDFDGSIELTGAIDFGSSKQFKHR